MTSSGIFQCRACSKLGIYSSSVATALYLHLLSSFCLLISQTMVVSSSGELSSAVLMDLMDLIDACVRSSRLVQSVAKIYVICRAVRVPSPEMVKHPSHQPVPYRICCSRTVW